MKTVTFPPRPSAPDTMKVLLEADCLSLGALLAKAPYVLTGGATNEVTISGLSEHLCACFPLGEFKTE